MARPFEYRGDLTQTTLPEMLFSIHRFSVPGVIEARREGTVKHIYVKEGSVVYATSSDIEDSLGNYLRRIGKLTPGQFEAAMQAREASNMRLGALLVERSLLGPAEVYQAIREQVEEIVWSLFYWQSGEVSFQIGDFDQTGFMRIVVPMRQVILEGIKRAPNPKALVARLGRKETVFEPSFQIEELIESGLDASDHTLLRLVDGRRSLYEVCTEGPLPAAENAKLMYAFWVLQLIRRAEGGPRSEVPSRPDTGQIKIRLRTERDRGEES